MENKTKRKLRFTSITDYKNLEEYFEKMAAKGWMLKEFKKYTMVFEEIEPRELIFNVSLFYNTTPFDYPDHEKENEYKELCEESGWTFCTSDPIYQVFYKEKNHEAVPIHTDNSEEFHIIKSTYMKTELISILALIPVLILGFLNVINFSYEDILSNSSLFNIISPFFILIIILSVHSYPVYWIIKNKINISKGDELYFSTNKIIYSRNIFALILTGIYLILVIFMVFINTPNIYIILLAFMPVLISLPIGIYCVRKFKTKKRSRKQNIIFFIGALIFSLLLTILISICGMGRIASSSISGGKNQVPPSDIKVLELSDFTKTASIERSRLRKKWSFFVPVNLTYYEFADKSSSEDLISSVDTQYIKCVNKDIADFVFEGYMKEQFQRKEERAREYREWGKEERAKELENDITEVSIHDWEVDRGYYLYESNGKVILQKDTVIYILDGNMDFSEKEIINICKNKLIK